MSLYEKDLEWILKNLTLSAGLPKFVNSLLFNNKKA